MLGDGYCGDQKQKERKITIAVTANDYYLITDMTRYGCHGIPNRCHLRLNWQENENKGQSLDRTSPTVVYKSDFGCADFSAELPLNVFANDVYITYLFQEPLCIPPR